MAEATEKSRKWIACAVRDIKRGDGADDSVWRAVGAAWEHADGKGVDIQLDAFPVNGRVVLREPQPQERSALRPAGRRAPRALRPRLSRRDLAVRT